ncbi:MAG: hypothetical protein ACRYFU_19055 [Janthinobacterium lividum]
MGKKLNADQKRAREAGELARFVQQYSRRARSSLDSNDRNYDRDLEKRLKRMSPDRLDQLLRNDDA